MGFNEDIFQQISVKSLTRHSSFVSLPKASKRELIENLFELSQLSVLRDLNKEKIRELDTDLSLLDSEEKKFQMLIKQEEENLDKLKRIKEELETKSKTEIQEKEDQITKHKDKVQKFKTGLGMLSQCDKDLSEQKNSMKLKQSEIDGMRSILSDLEKDVVVFESKIAFMEDKCEGCPKVIELIDDPGILNTKEQINNFVKSLGELKDDQHLVQKEMDRLSQLISNREGILTKLNVSKNSINILRKEVTNAKKQIDIKIDESNYKLHQQKLTAVRDKKGENLETLKYSQAIGMLLKDEGIRAHIIKKYLPLINKILNTYLQKFAINLELELTSDFDIKINTKFKEKFSYFNFSEGEKKRIDTALLFTFLDFCKIKHSKAKTNVLVIDEFASGLDPDGENVLYEILKDLAENSNIEVITISHSTAIDPDKIDRVFEASIERGFSQLNEIKE